MELTRLMEGEDRLRKMIERGHRDNQIPFRFIGKLAKLTIKLGPEQLRAADRTVVQDRLAHAQD